MKRRICILIVRFDRSTLAVLGGYLARTQLFGMLAYDPVVLGLAAVVLTLIALGAGLVPAIRAARVDPMRALRYE